MVMALIAQFVEALGRPKPFTLILTHNHLMRYGQDMLQGDTLPLFLQVLYIV